MPIGVWSTSSTRSTPSSPSSVRQPASGRLAPRGPRRAARSIVVQHVARERRLARARDAGDARPGGRAECARRCSCRLCSVAPPMLDRGRVARSTGAARRSGCRSGCARKRPVTESRIAPSARPPCPRRRRAPPRMPAPGPRSMTWSARRMVSSSCSTTTSVLPLRLELRERVEQDRGCRAGAGRWSARRGCSTRRAGWSRAARRGGCAAPRRRRASAPSGRAQVAEADLARGSRGGPRARRAGRARSRPRGRSSFSLSKKRCGRVDRRGASSSAIERSAEAHAPARSGSGARPSHAAQASSPRPLDQQSCHQISSPVCFLVEARRAAGRCRSSARTSRASS